MTVSHKFNCNTNELYNNPPSNNKIKTKKMTILMSKHAWIKLSLKLLHGNRHSRKYKGAKKSQYCFESSCTNIINTINFLPGLSWKNEFTIWIMEWIVILPKRDKGFVRNHSRICDSLIVFLYRCITYVQYWHSVVRTVRNIEGKWTQPGTLCWKAPCHLSCNVRVVSLSIHPDHNDEQNPYHTRSSSIADPDLWFLCADSAGRH